MFISQASSSNATQHVVSVLRHAVGFPVGVDPALEANTYCVTHHVSLTVVLTDCAVELAAANSQAPQRSIAGVGYPGSSSARDLLALVQSGVRVVALEESVQAAGLNPEHLLDGVEVLALAQVAPLLANAHHVLTW